MTRYLLAIILSCCVFSRTAAGSFDDPDAFVPGILLRCEPWKSAWKERRRVFLGRWGSSEGWREGSYIDREGRPHKGFFAYDPRRYIGFLTDPGGTVATAEFILPAEETMEFFRNPSDLPRKVSRGKLESIYLGEISELSANSAALDCRKESDTAPGRPPETAGPDSITSLLAKGAGGSTDSKPGSITDLERNADATKKGLGPDGAAAAPEEGAAATGKDGKIAPVKAKESKDGAKGAKNPTGLSERAGDAVCQPADNFKPVSLAGAAKPENLKMVGLRSNPHEAKGYDYIDTGDATLLQFFELGDAGGKLIPYESVGTSRWVSIPGDLVKGKGHQIEKLRLLIVGGAPEISISGLELTGEELLKQSGGRVEVEAEWWNVDASGVISDEGPYPSLAKLVQAAAAKADGRSPDVLDSGQLAALFDAFDRRLKAQSQPVDRIFWLKGAYTIPAGFPPRFEDFINKTGSGPALTNTSGKWFYVVTARMPGFSINYLKEPVYSLKVGEVIEEAGELAGERRRLIGDAGLLATRLRLGLKPAAVSPAPVGKLVFDAYEIFKERGYILSISTVTKLHAHLSEVLKLWTPDGLNKEVLARFSGKTAKKDVTLLDLLQNYEGESFLRLPRSLPSWLRKPVHALDLAEAAQANNLVQDYDAGLTKLLEPPASTSKVPSHNGCGYFYVSEANLGFEWNLAKAAPHGP
jgi:hypothetical protein